MDNEQTGVGREVVVTGMGLITPLDCGKGVDAFWGAVTGGVDAIGPVELFDTSPYSSSVAAEIKRFEAPYREDRWFAFLETAFSMALEDSGVDLTRLDMSRAGITLGTVLGGVLLGEEHWRGGGDCSGLPDGYHLYSGANRLAETIGVEGPVLTVSTACASGTDALGLAYRNILTGRTDIMIAGGGDTLSEFAFSGFNSLNVLTKTAVRPFDRERDGLALGEGAAFLVLEERGSAEKRGARIYSKLCGYASSADANHMTGPDREGRGLAAAMRAALVESGIERVDYINVHGTGTLYNDLMETKAIKSVFSDDAYGIPVSSVKSMLGHSFGAAGAVEAIVCVLSILNGAIPPTINLECPDPECDLDYVPGTAREGTVGTCLSLSSGFGGQNAALVLASV